MFLFLFIIILVPIVRISITTTVILVVILIIFTSRNDRGCRCGGGGEVIETALNNLLVGQAQISLKRKAPARSDYNSVS